MRREESGFTIPELIIMMIVTTLLTTLVITFAINFWSSAGTLQNDSTTLTTRLNAGDVIRSLLNVAVGLINQNSIADPNATVADPTAGSNYWLLLHAVPGTVTMPASGYASVMYFNAPSVTTAKTFIMNGSQPYQDEFALYLDGVNKQLMLRTLANPNASGDRLKTSCPPQLASSGCPADKILATSVSSVDLRYFSRSGNLINYQSMTDPLTGNYIGPDYPSVEVVEMTVHFTKKSVIRRGNDTSTQTIIRVAFRNG